ncbi:hypothetical protein [Paenibacillus gansuensis]|uniref:Uncharacterized protein n=1 Tax=Paenibacillus gansuensis TaxID=306542 RepID=A0ABW5PI03_9BACL
MHRKHAIEMVKSYTFDELMDWKKHVLFCLQWHKKDNNRIEIEDCEFLLKEIEDQMLKLKPKDT